MINILKKSFLIIMASFLIITLTSCEDEVNEATESVDYDDNLDAYEGVWYSGDDSGQAYILMGHGMYTKHTLALGENPERTESGLFKKIAGEDILSFGNPVDQTYSESYRLELQGDIIVDGDTQFKKVSSELDEEILSTLMVMEVPMEMYLGDWENENEHLTINDDGYSLYNSESIKAGDIDKMTDHLILYITGGQLRLEMTDDGGLMLESYDSIFYRTGE